eukprot:5550430-Prymnesium_polylepis.1
MVTWAWSHGHRHMDGHMATRPHGHMASDMVTLSRGHVTTRSARSTWSRDHTRGHSGPHGHAGNLRLRGARLTLLWHSEERAPSLIWHSEERAHP